jgi:hypothetical protein
MRSTSAAHVVARSVAVGLLIAGWGLSSAGIAGADPDPTPAPSPTPAPNVKTTMDHDGLYAVGTDIAPGVYSSAGPVGSGTCYWKRMGNPDGNLIDNALSKKAQVVKIDPTDKAFKTSGCQPWQPGGDPPPDQSGLAGSGQLQATLGILNGLLAPNGQHVPQP